MNKELAKTIAIFAAVVIAAIFLSGWFIRGCTHKCPPQPSITDSTSRVPPCTLYVDSSKIEVRDSIIYRYEKRTIFDTLLVIDTLVDSSQTFDIDTVLNDSAKLKVNVRAKLIIPPVVSSIIYEASPVIHKKLVYRDPLRVPKNNWKNITIGTLSGFTIGVAGTAALFILLTAQNK